LEDTFVFECTARVVSVTVGAEPETHDVVLDRTVFYPGGGGQPCDTGTISSSGAAAVFTVEKASPWSHESHGVIRHSGRFAQAAVVFAAGDEVTVRIDADRRVAHAKYHTGGHLLDCAMEAIGHPMEPTKGMHFPGQAYVGYSGDIPADARADTVGQLNATVARLIAEAHPVRVELLAPTEAAARMGVATLPPYLPPGKPVRFVTVATQRVGYPCAGTHIKHLGQLQSLTVTKIQKRGKELRVSYTVA
jgi:Ser-tRNA(Ala) deacylase AlaX